MREQFGEPTFEYVGTPKNGRWETRYPKASEWHVGELPFDQLPTGLQQKMIEEHHAHPEHTREALRKSIESGYATEDKAEAFLKDLEEAAVK